MSKVREKINSTKKGISKKAGEVKKAAEKITKKKETVVVELSTAQKVELFKKNLELQVEYNEAKQVMDQVNASSQKLPKINMKMIEARLEAAEKNLKASNQKLIDNKIDRMDASTLSAQELDERFGIKVNLKIKENTQELLDRQYTIDHPHMNEHLYGITHDPSNHPFKAAKDNSTTLHEFVATLGKEKTYKSKGVTHFVCSGKIPEDQLSHYVEIHDDMVRDPAIITDYQTLYRINGLAAEPYFNNKDGEIYEMVKKLFTTPYGSPANEVALMDIVRHFNITARQILWDGKTYKEGNNLKYFGSELPAKKFVEDSYKKNKTIKVPGTNHNRNVLKEIAWMVPHNYLLGIFQDEITTYDLIPGSNQAEAWNDYIDSQTDVPEDVKALFRINEEGKTLFADLVAPHLALMTSPNEEDTAPFEEENQELDKQFADAIALDDQKDDKIINFKAAKEENNIPVENVIEAKPEDIKEVVEEDKSEKTFAEAMKTTKKAPAKKKTTTKKAATEKGEAKK